MKKNIGYIIVTIITIFCVSFTTYAWYKWSENKDYNKPVSVSIEPFNKDVSYSISYINQPQLKAEGLSNSGYITNLSISKTTQEKLNATFYLFITMLPNNINLKDFQYQLVIDKEVIATGNFQGYEVGDAISLSNESIPVTSKSQTISLYLWNTSNIDIPYHSYKFKLRAYLSEE